MSGRVKITPHYLSWGLAMTGAADGVLLQAGGSGHELLGMQCPSHPPSWLPREEGELVGFLLVLWSRQQVGGKSRAWRRQQGPVFCPSSTNPTGTTLWFVPEPAPNRCTSKLLPASSPGAGCPKGRFGVIQLEWVIDYNDRCTSQAHAHHLLQRTWGLRSFESP